MTNSKKIGVLGLGSAIVDTCLFVPEDVVTNQNFSVGGSFHSNPKFIKGLLSDYEQVFCDFGGSAANVVKGIGLLGYRSGMIGIRSDDEYGEIIKRGLSKCNVEDLITIRKGLHSSIVAVCVHPSSQRTMFSLFDHRLILESTDIDWKKASTFEFLVFEGYLFNGYENIEIIKDFYQFAKQNNIKIVLVLADIFWANKYKERVTEAMEHASIISGTEAEYKQLFEIEDRHELIEFLKTKNFDMCAVTMGHEGAYVIQKGQSVFIPIVEGITAVDTVGAGDYFASGMLYAYLQGYDIKTCGTVGSILSGNIVSKLGNMPDKSAIDEVHEYLNNQGKLR